MSGELPKDRMPRFLAGYNAVVTTRDCYWELPEGWLLQQAESRPGCSTKGLITLNLFLEGICLG